MDKYEKLKISLRYFLIGAEYYKAVDALEFGLQHHTGMRKDGVTPEFQHQVEIAHYVRTLIKSLMYPEDTITAVLLHDVTEDYNVPHAEITSLFGSQVGDAVFLLDKNGKTTKAYFEGLATNAIASIVKGGDRIHNLNSMVGVFSPEKQKSYAWEVSELFLPMIKDGKRRFPKQETAYENIKHVLTTQLDLLEALNGPEVSA